MTVIELFPERWSAGADVDRANVLFRLGCCQFGFGAIGDALTLLTRALDLCDGTRLPCDRLRVQALDWRSRCHQRLGDSAAALADVEQALDVARTLGDRALLGRIAFHGSIVAERQSQWLLARRYAEEARSLLDD